MNSLKQVIVSAVIKVSTDPKYEGKEYGTSEEARRDFIKALIAELFPECPDCMIPGDVQSPAAEVVVEVPVIAEAAPVKEKKKRAPKKKEEAAEVVAPVEEAVVVVVSEEAPVKEKKKRAPKKKADAPAEEVAVVEAAPVEAPAAAPEKKKRGPKAKAEGAAVNHPKKLNKTEENKVKKIATELKVEAKDDDVLAYLNGLSAEEYAAKAFDEHVRTFLTPAETVVEEKVAKRGLLVEFKGKDYWVDPETKKVYATNGPVDEHIGDVGMMEYEEMEIPEHLPEDLEEIAN